MKLRYFTKDEFKCNCGCGMDVINTLKMMVDTARKYAGVPFPLSSGARCMEYNCSDAVKSKPTSSHPKGLAVDIKYSNSYEAYRIYEGLRHAGFKRIGWNQQKKFFHADIDADKPQQVLFPY